MVPVSGNTDNGSGRDGKKPVKKGVIPGFSYGFSNKLKNELA
jgi:hypothetical protein